MAKKQQLSLDEKLEQALVKPDEQPYLVPENWVWAQSQYAFKQVREQVDPLTCNVFNYVGLEHMKKDGGLDVVSTSEGLKSNKVVFATGDVLYGKLRPYLNKHAVVSFSGIASTDICVFRSKGVMDPKLFDYYLNVPQVMDYAVERSKGINLPRISPTDLGLMPIPIPPAAEQRRIVTTIESLFAKLDRAKELVQASMDSFAERKAAILHQAFRGELTRKWRRERGNEVCGKWGNDKLKDICIKITDGTHRSPRNTATGDYMYVTAKNIKENGVSLENITYITKEEHDEIYKRCNVEKGDVLYIKDGATTGIATVNMIDKEFSLLSSVALLKPNREKVDAKYLAYNLNSAETKARMLSNLSGNAITRLTLNKIQSSEIVRPLLEEQQEIVRILDELLEQESKAAELADALQQIDQMKQTILAKAFRGELGTNDPAEESALELLKSVLQEN